MFHSSSTGLTGRRLLSRSLGAGLLCMSVASSRAQDAPAAPIPGSNRDTVRVDKDPLARRSATENIVSGRIVNVDEHRLTIREGDGDLETTKSYRLSPRARFVLQDRDIKLSDVPASSRVRFQRGSDADSEISELYVVGDDEADGDGAAVRVTNSNSPVGFGMILAEDADAIKVIEIRDGGPAEKAGVRTGDVIVGLNDSVLLKPTDLFDATAKMSVGDRSTVTVRRDDENRKLTLEAGEGDSAIDSIRSDVAVKPAQVVEDDDAPHISTEVVPPVKLGATLETTPDGIHVVRMDDVSPLGDAGVRAGDYIRTAAGESVVTPQGLFRVLNRFDGGAHVELTAMRGDSEEEFTLTLPEEHEKVLVDVAANNAPKTPETRVRVNGVRMSEAELLQQILANQQRQQQQLNYLAQAMQRLAQAAGVSDQGNGVFGFAGGFPFAGSNGGANSNCYCAIGSNPQGNPVIGFTQNGTAVAVVSYDASGTPILAETTIASQGAQDANRDGLTNKDQNGDGLPDGPDRDGDGFPTAANANAGADSNCVCPIATDANGNPVIGVTQRGVPVAVVSTDANGNPIVAETTLPENGGDQTGQPTESVTREVPQRPEDPLPVARPQPRGNSPSVAPGGARPATPRPTPRTDQQ